MSGRRSCRALVLEVFLTLRRIGKVNIVLSIHGATMIPPKKIFRALLAQIDTEISQAEKPVRREPIIDGGAGQKLFRHPQAGLNALAPYRFEKCLHCEGVLSVFHSRGHYAKRGVGARRKMQSDVFVAGFMVRPC
jgi:hypothetical protein